MKITKLGHSCIFVEGEKNILIDPGNLVFMDGNVRAENLKNIDAVLLTHPHTDHVFIDALKVIITNNNLQIITNKNVGTLLNEHKIPWGEKPRGLPVEIFSCPHGLLPEGLPIVENTGFLVEGCFFHPGDSLSFSTTADIIALPVIAPWVTLREAVSHAKKLQPKIIIPIHDGFLKYPDFINNIIRKAWPDAPLKGMDGKPIEAKGF